MADIVSERHRKAIEKMMALRASTSVPAPVPASTSDDAAAAMETPTPPPTAPPTPPPMAQHTATKADAPAAPDTPPAPHTPTALDAYTLPHTSPYTSPHTAVYTSAQPPRYAPEPAPREHMVRTQVFLRPDQIAWLDELARRTGKGVTRSDWLRYCVDKVRREMEEQQGPMAAN